MKALTHLRLLLVLAGILLFGNSQAQLVAEFSSDVQQGCEPLEVHFDEMTSGGATSFVWDFGDGAGSTLANPVHVYNSAGNYDVRLYIMDNFGNIDSMVKLNYINVSNSFPISVGDSVREVSSCNLSDGAVYTTAFGIGAPYRYNWNTGDTTNNIFGLSTGFYSVTITSDLYAGCSWTKSYYVSFDTLELNSIYNNPTSCGSADGWINTNPTGGISPYTFNWSDGSNFQSRSSLSPGVYVLTVEDAAGCNAIRTFNLEADTSFVSATVDVEHILCYGGNDGVVTLSGTGGTPIYEYGTTPSLTTQDSVFVNLSWGWHTFYIEDANGCEGEVEVLVERPNPIWLTIDVTKHTTCSGCNDGAIDISVSGGTPPYSYLWSNNQTTEDINNLSSGTYVLTITDANGCDRFQNFAIGLGGPCGFIVKDSINHVSGSCSNSNGRLFPGILGGTGPFTYNWSTGDTAEHIWGLSQGQYSVTITDVNNCSQFNTYNVGISGLVQQTTISTVDNLCHGGNNGIVEFVSTGGVGPYHYFLNNGDSTVSPNARFDNLPAGTYDVSIVSDTGNCTSYESFTISEPTPISIAESVTHASCSGCSDGAIDITVSGGTPPYSYQWSNAQTAQDISSLAPGPYSVTVTDANGCDRVQNLTVGVDSAQGPCGFTVNADVFNTTSCGASDGFIELTVTGGVSPYFYSWNNGDTGRIVQNLSQGSYIVQIFDSSSCVETYAYTVGTDSQVTSIFTVDNLCHGDDDGVVEFVSTLGSAPYHYYLNNGDSTSSPNARIDNLPAGTYDVTVVSDNGNCTSYESFNITEPDPIQVYESVQHASCNTCSDGWAMVDSVSGGTAPYSYLWSNNEITQSISALLPGVYEVTVEDANGCERVQLLTIAVDSSSNNACGFNVTQNISPESACSSGDGSIEVISSVDPLATYSWSNGSTDNLIDNLNSGFYSVIVTDSNNCSEAFTYFVPTNQILTQIATVNNECNGDSDGVVEFQTTGDLPPYTYTLLATGDTSISPNGRFDNLPAGTYTVEIESGSGCLSYENFTISEPAPIQISGLVSNTSCGTCFDGNVDLIVQGGFTPYTFAWSNATFQQDLSGVSQGTYSVTVEDDNACTAIKSFFIDDSLSCSDCVWPGDANSDGIADNDDVLAVGIGYGISGLTRPSASLNWVAQQAPNWSLALASGANLKHVDCNGDALIDSTDLDAIALNYGLTHNKAEINGDKKVDAHLYYTFADDTVFAGQEVEVMVNYGRDSLPANNVYGIAFSMTFDSSFIEPSSLAFNANNSWLGTNGSNLLDFSKNLYADNKMDAAITKIDQINESGFGQIGILNFTMKDDISGKQLISLLNLGFSDVKVIDRNENQKSVFYEASELIVKQVSSGIDYNQFTEIQIVPNPAKGQVYLKNVNGKIERINIYDLSGRIQLSRSVDIAQSQNYELNISSLSNGVYLLETLGENGRSVNRLMIMN